MATERTYIDVTSAPFASSRFGLRSVAYDFDPADSHWRNGVEFQPHSCEAANTTRDSCLTAITTKSPTASGMPVFGADPFTVYAWVACSVPGTTRSEYERRTTVALERGENRAVEDVFWAGVINGETVHPHLAHDAVVTDSGGVVIQTAASPVTTGSAVSPVAAIGRLEGSLAECYGGEGVIHVPATAVAFLADRGLIEKDGDILRTAYGNRVAVYASNNRQGPNGVAATGTDYWFYATGAVTIMQTGVFMTPFAESIDRSKNSVVQIAERTYVIKWDCCHLAAQVALT